MEFYCFCTRDMEDFGARRQNVSITLILGRQLHPVRNGPEELK